MTLYPWSIRTKKGGVPFEHKTWGKPFGTGGTLPHVLGILSAVDHTTAKFIQGHNSLSHIFNKFRDIKQWDESTVLLSIYQGVGLIPIMKVISHPTET